jgi:hypothetical protein
MEEEHMAELTVIISKGHCYHSSGNKMGAEGGATPLER